MTRLTIPLALILALVAGNAWAAEGKGKGKIYKCRNATGETYYSQSYDPAKCGGGGAQMNPEGIAIKQIERPKTPEEVATEKAVALEAAEKKRIADEKQRAEDILMMSYPTEADLKRGLQEELGGIDSQVEAANLSIRSHEKSLAQWLAVAAEAERASTTVPANVTENIANVRKQLEEQRIAAAAKEAEKGDTQAKFSERLARYREIKAKQEKHLKGQ